MENMEKNNSASRKVPPKVPSRPMSPKDPQRGKELSSQNVGLSQEIFLEKPEKADVKEDKNQSIKFGKGNGNILNEQVKKRGKKKLIIALAIVFFVIIIGGGITGLVLNNQANNKKLLTPTLQVVQLYNGTVLQLDDQVGATKYEFVITDSNNESNTYSSTTNELQLNKYLNQPGIFSVKARALGKGAGATSDYSEAVTFTNYVKLATPNVFINNMEMVLESGRVMGYKNNTDLTDDTLTWDAVKNAEKYLVRYGVNTTTNTMLYEEVPAAEGVVSFSLSTIYEKGTGKYQISVMAIPTDGTYYLQSDYQEILSVEYYAKQTPVTEAIYNKETKELSFKLPVNSNYGSQFDLFVSYANGTKEHKIFLDSSTDTIEEGMLIVKRNLELVASGDIISMSLVTLSDGAYSTNSDAVAVTIN